MEKVEGGYKLTARKAFASGSPTGNLLMTSAVYDDPTDGPTVLHFAATGTRPSINDLLAAVGAAAPAVRETLAQLQTRRVLVLEADGESIRMAPPFSGVPTQHRVVSDGISYFANCAWDALGIPAVMLAVRDIPRSGTPSELMRAYGISAEAIVRAATTL